MNVLKNSVVRPNPEQETSSCGSSSIRAGRYDVLVREARSLPPVRAAVVRPCSAGAILAAVEVREQELFEPLLVGPEAKIRAAADAAKIDLGDIAIEDASHSHAAAARAVELAICEAAKTKGIVSAVAGEADILLAPDLEAGDMLAKQLIYFAGATAAGVVRGARVPIVLTSRSGPLSARIASATLAKLLVARNRVPGTEATI